MLEIITNEGGDKNEDSQRINYKKDRRARKSRRKEKLGSMKDRAGR